MSVKDLFSLSSNFLSANNPVMLAVRNQQDTILSFQREINRSLSGFYHNLHMPQIAPWGVAAANDPAEPLMDIIENGKEYRISLEAAGIDPNDVNISTSGRYLTVSGKKKEQKRENVDSYISQERGFGDFSRTRILPEDANLDQATAQYNSGVLTVHIPKKVEALEKSKSVAISKQPEMSIKLKVRSTD